MKESKLQYLGRTLAERVLITEGTERKTLISVLADVVWLMGKDVTLPESDPVYWFDPAGRFCTRAQTKEEIEDSMILMAIAEGVHICDICEKDPGVMDRHRDWEFFQQMKCAYMEALMRVQELEESLERLMGAAYEEQETAM